MLVAEVILAVVRLTAIVISNHLGGPWTPNK